MGALCRDSLLLVFCDSACRNGAAIYDGCDSIFYNIALLCGWGNAWRDVKLILLLML